MKNVFARYAQTGALINTHTGYENSPIGKLEKIVLAHIKSLRSLKRSLRSEDGTNEENEDHASTEETNSDEEPRQISDILKHYLGAYSIQNERDVLEMMFYAIVAPSMAGKTQSAFVFRKIFPLYFLLVKSSMKKSQKTQDIYKNFTDLSDQFRRIAVYDFERFQELDDDYDISLSIYDRVSAYVLATSHGDFKSLTLGFLVALIEHANTNFDSNTMNWMEFFATSSRNFTVRALSINEVRRLELGIFVLFFDEFQALGWTAFVRNLARAALIPLFVANTNTNAANLVGKDQSLSSRTESDFVWSLVPIRLNILDMELLQKINSQFDNQLNQLIFETEREHGLFSKFFYDFRNNQLKHLRPGFVELIIKSFAELQLAPSITLDALLQKIVYSLISELKKKKPRMILSSEAILGTFALFMSNAYLSEDDSELTHICHRKLYLQDHFYYLANPVDNTKWAFLTYPPDSTPAISATPTSQSSEEFDETVNQVSQTDRPLRVVRFPHHGTSTCSDWAMEYIYFKSEEIIPMFAFLAVVNEGSITDHFRKGMEKINASHLGTGDTRNMAQGVSLNGNELEVLATVCMIESSHHGIGEKGPTFHGQSGKSFLTNLIENLIYDNGFRRANNVLIDFHERTIGNILKSMHIPYLFPSGMDLPKFFKDHLSDAKGFNNRSVNFGEFHRTKNAQKIDATFKYFIKNEKNLLPSVEICAVECKNWSENLSFGELELIIDKAVENFANLSLVVCNSTGGAHDNTIDIFKQKSIKNGWNVLKISNGDRLGPGTKNFNLDRYCHQFPFAAKPALTCIVLELNVINS